MGENNSNGDKRRNAEIEDLKLMLSSNTGRRVLYRMLVNAGIFGNSYNALSQTHDLFFREGRRSIGLWLKDEIETASSDLYIEMLRENRYE